MLLDILGPQFILTHAIQDLNIILLCCNIAQHINLVKAQKDTCG
jgi:hypothetical protein